MVFYYKEEANQGIPVDQQKIPKKEKASVKVLYLLQLADYHNTLRRGRDSNPGYPFGVYTLSRRAS